MKALISIICVFNTLVCLGQLDFSLTPVPAFADSTAEAETFIAHAMIKNNTDETIVIAWQRLVNDLPGEWVSYICSNITCAPPDVSMGTFSLTANDSTNLDCYFQPEGMPGTGTVKLRLFLTGDTTQIINATYMANAILTNTEELWNKRVKVYPNPARDFLTLSSSEDIHSIELLDISGKRLNADFQFGRINIGHIPGGTYILKIYDAENFLISINRIKKIE